MLQIKLLGVRVLNNRNSGFSLTELSIVLVVVALLIAAVVQGANLLKSAKLKTVGSEFSEKQAWINGFRTIYNQLPGDFSYAANYWAAASTLSGDEDGEIEFYNGSAYEGYRAWEHLFYAEIADSEFSGGPSSPSTTAAQIGVDIPDSVVSNAGYFLDFSNLTFTVNVLSFGAPLSPSSNNMRLDGALSPQDAFKLDAKLDDNNPTTGSLRADDGVNSNANDCVTAGGVYDTTKTGIDCIIGYKLSTE